MSMSSDLRAPHVVIVGGGIAGLACARALEAAGDHHVTLVEASDRVGGKARGDRRNGFVLDAGCDVCIADKLRHTEAFEALALGERLVRVNPNDLPTTTLRDGQLVPVPVHFTGELVTFVDGMQGLVDALAGSLGTTEIQLNSPVARITHEDGGWRVILAHGRVVAGDAVVVALPGHEAGRLLQPFAPQAAGVVGELHYVPTTTVSLAWPRDDVPHDLRGTGYLVTGAGEGEMTACTWTSSKVPSHAPAGFVLVRGYVRGQVPDPVALVREQLVATMGITAAPMLTHVTEWSHGIPEYPADHSARVAQLERELAKFPGLAVAGGAFHGVGVPDCILSGEAAAHTIHTSASAHAS